jgi:hypothetical protein
LEQLAAAVPKPAPWEIQKYYAEHPELFAERRVFDLEEFTFAAEGSVAAELRERLAKTRAMQEIADWLQSRGVSFEANRSVRAAEQVPLGILPELQAMREGDIGLFDVGAGHFQVVRVVAFKPDPVDEATATPRIQQFLFNRRSREYMAEEMKQIKERARIEYLGEFADGAVAEEAKVESEGSAMGTNLTGRKSDAEIEAQAESEESSGDRSRN